MTVNYKKGGEKFEKVGKIPWSNDILGGVNDDRNKRRWRKDYPALTRVER